MAVERSRGWVVVAGIAVVGALLTALLTTVVSRGQEKWYPSRWGADDQRGAANRITPAKVLEAKTAITAGKVYQLGHVYEVGMASRYAKHQMMDAVFTVAEMTMLAETSNSVMLDRDTGNNERFPPNVPYRVSAEKTGRRLIGQKARITPLEPSEWSPEVRRLLDPTDSGRSVAAVYRTFAQHIRMYAPRQVMSEYIRTQSTLDARTRELLIMPRSRRL